MAEAVFPEASEIVHVTVVFPTGNAAGALFTILTTEQLSAIVGLPRDTADAVHSPKSAFTLTAAGAVIVGFWLSTTVTVCTAVAVFPNPSVTVHVTVVVPTGKKDGASFVMEATKQLSEVTGVPITTPLALQVPASATVLILAGAVIVGFVLSKTVIVI